MTKVEVALRVNDFYRLLLSDLPALFDQGLATEDIVWDNFLPENFPFGGTYKGRSGLETYVAELGAGIEIKDFQISNIFVDDNTATVVGSEVSNVIATGKPYQMDWVHLLRFNDVGAVEYLREYNDTARMAVAFAE
jgi:uncharacterized protein